jgi:hypothetical protein
MPTKPDNSLSHVQIVAIYNNMKRRKKRLQVPPKEA